MACRSSRRCRPRRCPSNSSRRRPTRWRPSSGPASGGWSRWRPRFVSVTYGAGGTTQARTHATVSRIVQETSLTPAAHLTCVGASRGEVDDVARGLLGGGRAAYRGAARRPAGRRRALRAASGRLCLCRRPGRRADPDRALRDQRRRLSGDASDRAFGRPRPRQPEAEDRCRGDPGDHPVLLRYATSSCASSTAAWRPASPCRSCRASCRSPTSPR